MKKKEWIQIWLFTPVISALGRLRQENNESEASMSYIVLCLKKQKKRGGEVEEKEED
jgi:hypothetical protein